MLGKTIPELLQRRFFLSPDSVAHWTLDQSGKWRPTTWADFWATANILASGLETLGIREHQRVGIMAHTSQNWEFLQMAILISGGVVVGIDPYDREDNISEIARCAGLTALVIETPDFLGKIIKPIRDKLEFIVSLKGIEQKNEPGNCKSLQELIEIGSREHKENRAIRSRDHFAATIVFTSGTTGKPRGIEYTHYQVLLACSSIIQAFSDIREDCNLVCWLPLSNLFQRIVNFCGIRTGASSYFIENPRDVVKYLPSINPHVFIGVPRFFEKLHQGIMDEIAKKPAWMRKIIQLAIRIGDRHAKVVRCSKNLGFFWRICHLLADPIILKRLRSVLGHKLRYMISGSAPMPLWLLEWYHSIGILILEAYGISENIIPNSMNRTEAYRFGTVGKPLSGNQIIIADDGELLVRGEGVCKGYYGNSGDTPLTDTDYRATGDYAEIDKDGYITLTGRKSEVFKTSTGRRIAPAAIESFILKLPYVDYAMVCGRGEKFLVVLLSVSYETLAAYAKISISGELKENLQLTPELRDVIKKDVKKVTAGLAEYQKPAGFLVTFRPFTIHDGDLTPNLKLRRNSIENKYKPHIEQIYKIHNASKAKDIVICNL